MTTKSFSPFRIKDLYNEDGCIHVDKDKDGKCDKCGEKISQPVDNNKAGQEQANASGTLPNTGDDSSLRIWIMMFVISSLAIPPCLIRARKKKAKILK